MACGTAAVTILRRNTLIALLYRTTPDMQHGRRRGAVIFSLR
jgi:hypothetical protein